MNIKIHFDGACNNQHEDSNMGIGVAVFINNEYCEELSKFELVKSTEFERGTSNIAEWLGCVEAMKLASELKDVEFNDIIEVYSDSKLITEQFNGNYKINKLNFLNYYRQAKYYSNQSGVNKINWVSRKQNKEADRLSKKGLRENNSSDCPSVSINHKQINKTA
jgi:ribonuclease HI